MQFMGQSVQQVIHDNNTQLQCHHSIITADASRSFIQSSTDHSPGILAGQFCESFLEQANMHYRVRHRTV